MGHLQPGPGRRWRQPDAVGEPSNAGAGPLLEPPPELVQLPQENELSVARRRDVGLNGGDLIRQLVDPGSVGQPRDNDPRTSFCVFDGDSWTYEYYRADYPIVETQAKIIRQGIAPVLARRLALGQ